jgi:hypothetical protein
MADQREVDSERGGSCATGCAALAVAIALGALLVAGGVAMGYGLFESVRAAIM